MPRTTTHAPPPERIRWAVEQLFAVQPVERPAEQLLEIGCGAGHAVALVCARLARGTITAIDRSATMVARARERNASAVAAGRARIEQQSLVTATLARRFDTAFAIDVNAFWTTPTASLAALRRLLDPVGTAYLVFHPPTLARLHALERSLPILLDEAGFRVADVRVQPFRAGSGLCIIGRPTSGHSSTA